MFSWKIKKSTGIAKTIPFFFSLEHVGQNHSTEYKFRDKQTSAARLDKNRTLNKFFLINYRAPSTQRSGKKLKL